MIAGRVCVYVRFEARCRRRVVGGVEKSERVIRRVFGVAKKNVEVGERVVVDVVGG